MELLALRELTQEELEALAMKLRDSELVIFFSEGVKRVFLGSKASLSVPLASLVEVRESELPWLSLPVSAGVGLSLPYPIPLFELGDGRRNTLRESFARCALAFNETGLRLRLTEASNGDGLRVMEFLERRWRKGIFFNGWRKDYEEYLEGARRKASQLLLRASIGAIGEEGRSKEMLSCLSSGLHNKLVIGGKSAVFCVEEVAELIRPQPRPCSVCTSKVLKRAPRPAIAWASDHLT